MIDDEPLVCRLVERALRRGHRVTVAVTGREGLEKVLGGDVFDLILCDLMMPEMTGMDLYEKILAHSPPQAERMVFLTGGAFTPRAREFLDRRPFLEKPFDLRALEALVLARLARHHSLAAEGAGSRAHARRGHVPRSRPKTGRISSSTAGFPTRASAGRRSSTSRTAWPSTAPATPAWPRR